MPNLKLNLFNSSKKVDQKLNSENDRSVNSSIKKLKADVENATTNN